MTDIGQTLKGLTAIITGAGGGIGRALALSLAARGANVVATVRRGPTGDETVRLVEAEGGVARSFVADCAEYDAIAASVAFAEANFGGLDIMIHNAVYGHGAERDMIDNFTDDKLTRMLDVCLSGAFNCAHAAFPLLKQSSQGRFVAMSSAFGIHAAGIDPGYAAIKSGTRGFIKALAREWAPYHITANAFAPAALSEGSVKFFSEHPEVKAAYYANYPFGRMGDPRDDIAEAIAATCGPEFKFMTAQTIILDGAFFTAL